MSNLTYDDNCIYHPNCIICYQYYILKELYNDLGYITVNKLFYKFITFGRVWQKFAVENIVVNQDKVLMSLMSHRRCSSRTEISWHTSAYVPHFYRRRRKLFINTKWLDLVTDSQWLYGRFMIIKNHWL